MKYLSEKGGMLTSVHDWKPVTPEHFALLLHRYATVCAADQNYDDSNEGMGGIWPHAYKLDRVCTATIWYMPKSGKAPDAVSSPVLLTITRNDGKIICFESLSYGLEEMSTAERMADTLGHKRQWKLKVPDDGIERVNTGINIRSAPIEKIVLSVDERRRLMNERGYRFNKEIAGWYWLFDPDDGRDLVKGEYRFSSEIEAIGSAEVAHAGVHDSDCAQHNEPAARRGPCDCSLSRA